MLPRDVYSPKKENSEQLGNFDQVSLLNIDLKVMFWILTKQIIEFIWNNWYIDESIKEASMP